MNFKTFLDGNFTLWVYEVTSTAQVRFGDYHVSLDFLYLGNLHHQRSLRLFPVGVCLTPVLVSAQYQAQCNLGEHQQPVILVLVPGLEGSLAIEG